MLPKRKQDLRNAVCTRKHMHYFELQKIFQKIHRHLAPMLISNAALACLGRLQVADKQPSCLAIDINM